MVGRRILLNHPRRMGLAFDRFVFCRKSKRIKTHRMKDVKPLHHLHSANHVGWYVIAAMTDTKSSPRRIGKEVHSVELRSPFDGAGLKQVRILPARLPGRFKIARLISVSHRLSVYLANYDSETFIHANWHSACSSNPRTTTRNLSC